MKKYKTVAEFMDDLSAAQRKQVVVLRKSILAAAPVMERIKWNAPSYVYNGEDRITFNMHGDDIKVLLHMGAKRPEDKTKAPVMHDATGLVEWNSDIRGTISFKDINDVLQKQADFNEVVKQWLAIAV